MSSQPTRSLLVGVGLFAAGWLAAQMVEVGMPPIGVSSPVAAASPRSELASDQFLYALTFGVASIAVDSELATIRLNELQDRHAVLERRVAQIEAQIRR